MTREEAVFELIKYRRRLEEDPTIIFARGSFDAEPFDMAVEALEHLNNIEVYMHDFDVTEEEATKALEKMSRYYEESEIMKALDSNLVGTYDGLVLNVDMDEFLDGVPTADVVERKHGEWIQHVNEPSLWSCSICETVIYSEHEEDRLKFHKWCGCCGADMRGGDANV